MLASGKDVNIMVFDTRYIPTTGGQAFKATSIGAVAQFVATGKAVAKKSLAVIAMSYGYIYVAQVAMGANHKQTLKAIAEARPTTVRPWLPATPPARCTPSRAAWQTVRAR